MARFPINEDEWLKMQREISSIKQRLKLTDIEQQHEVVSSADLTEIQKAIINYVKQNPGSSKQAIVDNLGMSSRGPIFTNIQRLNDWGIIMYKKNEANRQTYKLFINSENLIVGLVDDMESYKKSFFRLSRHVTDLPDSVPIDLKNSIKMLFAVMLLKIHICFVISYFLTALFRWPIIARSDKETLNKLYSIFFSNVHDLQFEFVNSINRLSNTDFESIGKWIVLGMNIQKPIEEMAQSILYMSHKANEHSQYSFLFKEGGQGKELESVMDIVWKNSKDFLSFKDVNGKVVKQKIEDWRDIEKFIEPIRYNKKAARDTWIGRRIRELGIP
jgi:hypothetical protein